MKKDTVQKNYTTRFSGVLYVFLFFLFFSLSSNVLANTELSVALSGTPPSITINNCSSVFGGGTYDYVAFWGTTGIYSASGGLPCSSPPFVSNVNTFITSLGGSLNSGNWLRFEFYNVGGNTLFASFQLAYDGNNWTVSSSSEINLNSFSTTTVDYQHGFLDFLNVPSLLETKVPFAYLFQIVNQMENLNAEATGTIPSGTFNFTLASGTPYAQAISVDLFSTSTIGYFFTPTEVSLWRGILVMVTYFSTAWFLFNDVKRRKVI